MTHLLSKYFSKIEFAELPQKVFLFSFVNQSIVSLSIDEYSKIVNDQFNDLPCQLQKELTSYGFIVKNHLEDFYKLKYFYNKSAYANKIGSLTLVTTMECNLSCYYCIQNHMKKNSRLTEERTKSVTMWLDRWLTNSKLEKMIVNVIGGEPFLNMSPVWEVNKVLKSSKVADYGFNFITNGTLIDEDILCELTELPVTSVQLTFDGDRESHNKVKHFEGQGTYDKLIHAANLLVSNGIPLDIRINYPKGNIDFAMKALEQLAVTLKHKTGVNVYFAHIVDDNYLHMQCHAFNKEYDNLKILFERSLQLGFRMPNPVSSIVCLGESDSSFVIDPDCKVYKCYNGVGVANADFGYIRNGQLFVDSYKQLTRDVSPRCLDCKYLPICHGGCHLKKNLAVNDDYNACQLAVYDYIENDLLPLFVKQIISQQSLFKG